MTKTFKDIRENIAAGQLTRLKKEYEPLRKIDMSKHKDQVKKTTMMLRKLNKDTLIDLSKKDIPWISDIAKSLVMKDYGGPRVKNEEEVTEEFIKENGYWKHGTDFRKWSTFRGNYNSGLLSTKDYDHDQVKAIAKKIGGELHFTDVPLRGWIVTKSVYQAANESLIVGLNKSSAEYKAGKAAAKKGEKYDANPHAPGVKRLNWSTGHNDFRADALRKAGKPNYGARGQFEELIREADLTKSQIKMVHDKADELPKNDFIKRYGKDGDAVRFATATNIVKKKLGIED